MLNYAIAVGPTEIAIVLVLALILFGAKRLPEAGRSLGQGMREFKESVTGKDGERDEPSSAGELPAGDAPPASDTLDTDRATADPAGTAGDTRR